mgnify:CR=1 FL=1
MSKFNLRSVIQPRIRRAQGFKEVAIHMGSLVQDLKSNGV